MYLGERELEEAVVFYAQMIDTGGSQIDATGNVNYIVREGELGAVVFAGQMTLLGGVGTGFYSETLDLLALFGYQADTWYSIWISAIVDGELPAAFHTFKIVNRPTLGDIADAVWDEPTAGHAFAQSFGALQYVVSQHINQVVADAANTTTSFRTDYGLAREDIILGKILTIAGTGAARIVTAYDPVTDFVTIAPALEVVPAGGTPIPVMNIPTFWEEVWRVLKANVQGETGTGNIAEDTDNLQTTGKEG